MRKRMKPRTTRLRLRKMLRRQDYDFLDRRRALIQNGYLLPLSNKEVKAVLASKEDRSLMRNILRGAE